MSEHKVTKIGLLGVDTSFLIDFFAGEPSAVRCMQQYASHIRLSELVVYEFLCGKLSQTQQSQFLQAISSIPSISFSRQACVQAAQLFRKARIIGKRVGHQDCLIAGSYMCEGVNSIISRNTKHFKSIEGFHILTY